MRIITASFLPPLVLSLGCASTPQERVQVVEAERTEARAQDKASDQAPAAPRDESSDLSAPPDVSTPPQNALRTESGVAYVVLRPGKGDAHPTNDDRVSVHYTGWTKSGEMFDSSHKRGRPTTFPVGGVIPGYADALKVMTAGERVRVWIPAALAYGDEPAFEGAPAGQLTFDIELLEVVSPPRAPADVAEPPPTAQATKSGLRYVVIAEGAGRVHPSPTSLVTVHYTGWTTDGAMFDSSVLRGQPASFGLDQVIEGWSEGVQLMVVGQKARFWIPEELAYKGRAGAPAGTLVFDIELLDFEAGPPLSAKQPSEP